MARVLYGSRMKCRFGSFAPAKGGARKSVLGALIAVSASALESTTGATAARESGIKKAVANAPNSLATSSAHEPTAASGHPAAPGAPW